MNTRFVWGLAAAVVIGGSAGCSSDPTPPLRPGTLDAGSANVTVNDKSIGTIHSVQCSPSGDLTTIVAGDGTSGVTAVVSTETGLAAKSVSINNVSDFTGNYVDGITTPNATVTMTGQTYEIAGTAEGFNTGKPARVASTFVVKVAC